MAKKQTRRSISINRKLYERVKEYCRAIGKPMSTVTEGSLMNEVESVGVTITLAEANALKRAIMGDHFDANLVGAFCKRIEKLEETKHAAA